MAKRKTNVQAEANISIALEALELARGALFTNLGSLQRARRNSQIRETEWLICDAIKFANGADAAKAAGGAPANCGG